MTRRRWLLPVGALALALALGGWFVGDDALARVGGGQSYGSGSSSGSSGGGGGGDIDVGLILFLIRLVVEFPAIGIPVVLAVGVVWFLNRPGGTVRARPAARSARTVAAAPRRVAGLAALQRQDPDFSIPVFLDYAVMVHRRALEAAQAAALAAPLAPFVAGPVLDELRKRLQGRPVSEVACGAARVIKVERGDAEDRLFVRIETTRLEGGERVMVEDWLAFRRATGARSLPPERMEALACPSCGSAVEVTVLGACTHCDAPVTRGQLQWQVVYFEQRSREVVTGPQLALGPGGDEPGVRLPVVVSPTLARDLAGLGAFDEAALQARVRTAFLELQAAWTAGRWERARPFVTDRMFQTLRFWMDQYARANLRNVLEDVQLLESRVVEASADRWLHAVTVRIVGRMKDSTVDASGRVVGGNAKVARRFAEYWTFVRSVEAPAAGRGAPTQCPSCGAPLDRVDETGVCGYCSAKITSGRFDWVLSRIEQPAAYR